MSNPILSAGMFRSGVSSLLLFSEGSVPITWSTGRTMDVFSRFAASRIFEASASLSSSTRLLPTSAPCALRKVYAMAPPISSASTLGSRLSMTLILSLTLAPPRMATKGFSGFFSTRPRYSISFFIRKPAAFSFTKGTIPAVEAWARCAVPNASLM
jgi:hypothetical protein